MLVTIALDLAVRGLHITDQSVIYRRMPEAHNCLTSGYMTSYFAGGAFGSLLSAMAYQSAGWNGVSLDGGRPPACLINLLLWLRTAVTTSSVFPAPDRGCYAGAGRCFMVLIGFATAAPDGAIL